VAEHVASGANKLTAEEKKEDSSNTDAAVDTVISDIKKSMNPLT